MNEIEFFKNAFQNNLINNYRIKIDTGFTCNANCFFCYYRNHLKDPFMKIEKILYQIKIAKSLGFQKMEFSGGESSYHPDWFKILDKVKSLDLQSSTLSNGFMFSDYSFLKKSKEKGLGEILFSLHSYKDNHDKHLGVKGAFNKISKAIKNSLDLDIITRINITITSLNQDYLNDLFEYLDKEDIFKYIRQFNFLPINEWSDAKNVGIKSQNKIKIEKLYNSFDKILDLKKEEVLNIRYYSPCLIDQKYHKNIKNYIHHYTDKFDWHPFFIYYSDFFNKEKIKAFKNKNLKFYLEMLNGQRESQSFYSEVCNSCSHKNLCDGFKKGFEKDK